MPERKTKEECIQILCAKAAELDRLPNKSDFTEFEAARIKAYFGPWPRALEAAGLKEPRSNSKIFATREKRARLKARRIEASKKLHTAQNQMSKSKVQNS